MGEFTVNNPLKDLPAKPQPNHPIIKLVRSGSISIYQLSLRLNKSYSHTANLISGYAYLTSETKKIFDDIIENLGS